MTPRRKTRSTSSNPPPQGPRFMTSEETADCRMLAPDIQFPERPSSTRKRKDRTPKSVGSMEKKSPAQRKKEKSDKVETRIKSYLALFQDETLTMDTTTDPPTLHCEACAHTAISTKQRSCVSDHVRGKKHKKNVMESVKLRERQQMVTKHLDENGPTRSGRVDSAVRLLRFEVCEAFLDACIPMETLGTSEHPTKLRQLLEVSFLFVCMCMTQFVRVASGARRR